MKRRSQSKLILRISRSSETKWKRDKNDDWEKLALCLLGAVVPKAELTAGGEELNRRSDFMAYRSK